MDQARAAQSGSRRSTLALVALCLGSCFIGNISGFFIGVASTRAGQHAIEAMASSERAADVEHPLKLARASFALDYPSNWKIVASDERPDVDHGFTIDSPGSCHIQFVIFDLAMDPEKALDAQVTEFTKKLIRDPVTTRFTKWGRYEGAGAEIHGSIAGALLGRVKIFALSTGGKTFTIVEHLYDDDRAMVEPGFRLIESSFEVKTK